MNLEATAIKAELLTEHIIQVVDEAQRSDPYYASRLLEIAENLQKKRDNLLENW